MPPSWHPAQPTAIRSQARLFLCAWRMQPSSTTEEVAPCVCVCTPGSSLSNQQRYKGYWRP